MMYGHTNSADEESTNAAIKGTKIVFNERENEDNASEGAVAAGAAAQNNRTATTDGEDAIVRDPTAGPVYTGITWSTKVYALCAAINSCNLGYDIGVNTGVAPLLEKSMELSETQVEIFLGSINLFAMVGSLCAGVVSDKFGRRRTFLIAAVGFILGVVLTSTANTFALLMVGRLFVGMGVGFGIAIDPIYISEISPPEHRGMLVTWSELAINIGILLGFSTSLIFYDLPANTAWRFMIAIGALLPIVMLFVVTYVMPETPRWLVQKGRDGEAVYVLQKVYGPGHNVDEVVDSIRESIQKEQEAERAVGWGIVLQPTPAYKRILFVGVGVAAAQQIVGIDAIQYFLAYIMEESGIEGRGMQGFILIMFGLLKVAMVFVAASVIDTKGRRPMFFISLGGIITSLVLLGINFLFGGDDHNGPFTIFCLALYLAAFGIGMGPGAWLIPSEVFPTTIRAKAMSVSTFINRFFATIMASTFLSLTRAITWAGFFMALAVIAAIILVLIHKFLPETKGKSLEDMAGYFAKITGDTSVLQVEELHAAAKTLELSGGSSEPPSLSDLEGDDNEGVNTPSGGVMS